MTKRNFIMMGIIVVFALLIIALMLTKKTPETEEVPDIILPLAFGKRTYEMMTDNPQNLQIIKIEVNPLDVKQGESQQVTVWVEDTEDKPITVENKVEGSVFTDNKTTPLSFKLREISDANGATLTIWEGSWALDDTCDIAYMINLVAKSADREYETTLTFR